MLILLKKNFSEKVRIPYMICILIKIQEKFLYLEKEVLEKELRLDIILTKLVYGE